MTDELSDTLCEIVQHLRAAGIDFMLVGSVAALAHGRSRATNDFDMVIVASADQLRVLVASLPPQRFYAAETAALEALAHESLFNVIDMTTGWKVDSIPRKARPFSQAEFARREALDVLGVRTFVATVEDVVIAKLEWATLGGSERQLEDVRALVELAGEGLDRAYVQRWVGELGLEEAWAAVSAPGG